MPGAIEKLIGNHKIQRLMLFLQRAHGRYRHDALDTQLLEAVNIRAKIQFAGQNSVSAAVARQECDLAPFQLPQYVGVGRIAERRLLLDFAHLRESRHRIQPTASNDSDLRLRQASS